MNLEELAVSAPLMTPIMLMLNGTNTIWYGNSVGRKNEPHIGFTQKLYWKREDMQFGKLNNTNPINISKTTDWLRKSSQLTHLHYEN